MFYHIEFLKQICDGSIIHHMFRWGSWGLEIKSLTDTHTSIY